MRLQKPRAISIAIIVVVTAFSVVLIVPSTSLAASAPSAPSYYHFIGYNGNDSIYMTDGAGNSQYPTYLGNYSTTPSH